PPSLYDGENSCLSIIGAEVRKRGLCDLTLRELSRRSSACRTTCQNAIAWAERRGLITVERRRAAHDRCLPNIIRICSPIWTAWLRLRPGPARSWGGGVEGTFKTATRDDPVQQQSRPGSGQSRPPASIEALGRRV